MRGQKRVEDARERAYDRRIHLHTKNDGLHRNSGLPELRVVLVAASWVNPTCGAEPGNDDVARRFIRSLYPRAR
jgi:hypothetical protein